MRHGRIDTPSLGVVDIRIACQATAVNVLRPER